VVSDRQRWDARYESEDARATRTVDALVVEAIEALHPQPLSALDLAGGSGRHSLWLAARGIATEVWDVSPVGLALIRNRAQASGHLIETREVDLDEPLPAATPRGLVLVVDYLNRELFAKLHALVTPGGVAVVCTFTDDFPGQHPSARFRLRPGELRALPGLAAEFAREHRGRALLVGRKI
jgi:SAM-dependent methyltransferase